MIFWPCVLYFSLWLLSLSLSLSYSPSLPFSFSFSVFISNSGSFSPYFSWGEIWGWEVPREVWVPLLVGTGWDVHTYPNPPVWHRASPMTALPPLCIHPAAQSWKWPVGPNAAGIQWGPFINGPSLNKEMRKLLCRLLQFIQFFFPLPFPN